MEKLSVWFCGLYTTPCLTGLLYGYDTVSISGAIDFLQDKYALSPALQGLVISSIMIGGVIGAGFLRLPVRQVRPPPKHWSPRKKQH